MGNGAPDLTDEQRAVIVSLYEKGEAINSISEKMGLSTSGVWTFVFENIPDTSLSFYTRLRNIRLQKDRANDTLKSFIERLNTDRWYREYQCRGGLYQWDDLLGWQKKCPRCGEHWPLSAEFFNMESNAVSGLHPACRACVCRGRGSEKQTRPENIWGKLA